MCACNVLPGLGVLSAENVVGRIHVVKEFRAHAYIYICKFKIHFPLGMAGPRWNRLKGEARGKTRRQHHGDHRMKSEAGAKELGKDEHETTPSDLKGTIAKSILSLR